MDLAIVITEDKPKIKKNKSVLNEEIYTENLEKIIVRDFFPDHEKLKDHKEYLAAEERKDFERMRELALKHSTNKLNKKKRTSINDSETISFPSPVTFETPISIENDKLEEKPQHSKKKTKNIDNDNSMEKEKSKEDKDIVNQNTSLNKFLSKYTSEDNESFENIMEVSNKEHREKYAWLYEAEIKHSENNNKLLELPSSKDKLAIEDKDTLKMIEYDPIRGKITTEVESFESRKALPADSWKYKAKNHLMYYPEGCEESEDTFKKPLVVVHRNTRFKKDPFKDTLDRTKLVEAAAQNAKFIVGEKVGHDGNAILPQNTPTVKGYGYVATPSPMPGVDASPLMTWGVIEDTPARLNNSTPTPGPSFKFPEESRREKLAHKMVDDNTKKKRAKKEAAIRQVTRNLASKTPSTIDRISTLSPAARRLVSRKMGLVGNDKSLKASYTPKRSQRLNTGSLTPLAKTPKLTQLTPKSGTPNNTSITDNLLNISKNKVRKKAADFF